MQSALTKIGAVIPDALVAVRYAGLTGTGLKGSTRTEATLDGIGERGLTLERAYLSQAVFAVPPDRGAPINVDGVDCIATETRADPAGGMWVVEYQQQRKQATP